jgi:transposase
MAGTMTWVGFDVRARSMHGAAIDSMTGELTRRRFGAGVTEPVAWLESLTGPVRACYVAGPTGFGLYRVAVAAGIRIDMVAPGKTPRGPSDRVKTDRRDAELLARCLLAGSLKAVTVAAPGVKAARELARAHDACRRDLMDARHRVSKMLLRHGIVPRTTRGAGSTAAACPAERSGRPHPGRLIMGRDRLRRHVRYDGGRPAHGAGTAAA